MSSGFCTGEWFCTNASHPSVTNSKYIKNLWALLYRLIAALFEGRSPNQSIYRTIQGRWMTSLEKLRRIIDETTNIAGPGLYDAFVRIAHDDRGLDDLDVRILGV